MNDTVDKFGLGDHFVLRTTVDRIEWDEASQEWEVHTSQQKPAATEILRASIVISAVGSLSVPNDMVLDGLDQFKGRYWHSARWDHSYDWRGKDIAIIGNGCSAAQMVPDMLHDGVGSIVQFGQSAHWYMPRNDPEITPSRRFLFRNVPLALKLYRFWLFYRVDAESITLEMTPRGRRIASKVEKVGINHIQSTAPSELHDALIPKDTLGCKRRVNDGTNKGSYLASLNNPKMTLIPRRAVRLEGDSIVAQDGRSFHVDAVCFATGYKVTQHLVPMVVRGKGGKTLKDVWSADEGSHAFNTISVSGFPNFGLMFGPNGFPSNNSCIFQSETQIEYIERFLLRPLLVEKSCSSIDVKRDVEVAWFTALRERLTTMVWSTGCTNYQRNEWGHNTSNYPYSGATYRRHLVSTSFDSYDVEGRNARWGLYRLLDWVRYWPWALWMATICFVCDKVERAFPLI